jgi:hypothetical protein
LNLIRVMPAKGQDNFRATLDRIRSLIRAASRRLGRRGIASLRP